MTIHNDLQIVYTILLFISNCYGYNYSYADQVTNKFSCNLNYYHVTLGISFCAISILKCCTSYNNCQCNTECVLFVWKVRINSRQHQVNIDQTF